MDLDDGAPFGRAVEGDRGRVKEPEPQPERLVVTLTSRHGGTAITHRGSGSAYRFDSALEAFACALELQRTLEGDAGTSGADRTRARIGLCTLDVPRRDDQTAIADAVVRCSHICSLARPGQTLLSRSMRELVADHLPPETSLRDLGRQRLRDLSHTENVWQLCHPDLQAAFAPLRSLDVVPNNLPMQATTFIGRERVADDVKHHLSSTRLLTITGAGGCGKTRLSLDAAVDLLEAFPDGVWWVDLAPIADPALVAKTVATAACVQEIPNQPILTTIGRSLHDRQVLIMLDNCEHVIEACAHLAQSLLSTTLSLSLMATSREPLGVSGEVTFRIPSMTFPPDPPPGTIESLGQYEAVRLFIDRALRANPEFRATNESAPAIAEICYRLDGIPLALELAAARTRVLTPDQIAEGLSDVFHVLTGSLRTALPRQRTIEASIDWSHDLLTPKERTLFRRLGAFAGGFTLEGAEKVCSGDEMDTAEILDLLTGLVDKSLVQMDNEPRVGRYRLLETIRHYAGQMLGASGEAAAVRTRHLEHMVELAERAAPRLESAEHQAVADEIDADVDNFRAALDWSLEQEDGSHGLRIAGALWLYWEARGVGEGIKHIRAGLARPGEDRRARAAALYGAALLNLTMGDPISSLGYTDEAAAISRETGDKRILARSVGFGGLVRTFLDPVNARTFIDEGVELARSIGDDYELCEVLIGRGFLEREQGALSQARASAEEALVAATAAGNPVLLARGHFFVGWTLLELTLLPGAREELAAANSLASAIPALFWMNFSRSLLAIVDLLGGSVERARDELAGAAAEAMELASGFGIAISLWGACLAARAVGDLETARTVTAQAVPVQTMTGLRWLGTWSLASLAETEVAHDELASARAHIEAAAILAVTPNPFAEGHVDLARAGVASASDDLEGAENFIHRALSLFTESKHLQGMVDALEGLARLLARLESHRDAARLIGAVVAARGSLGYVRFPVDGPAFAEAEAGCRSALGVEAFEDAIREGSGLSLEEAGSYASRGRGARKRPSAGWASLSPAEHDVVRLVAQGLTNAAIGKSLFISPRTVQAHLARVFAKLGVASRTELAAEAIKRGQTSE